jgi:hypothetical protein
MARPNLREVDNRPKLNRAKEKRGKSNHKKEPAGGLASPTDSVLEHEGGRHLRLRNKQCWLAHWYWARECTSYLVGLPEHEAKTAILVYHKASRLEVSKPVKA